MIKTIYFQFHLDFFCAQHSERIPNVSELALIMYLRGNDYYARFINNNSIEVKHSFGFLLFSCFSRQQKYEKGCTLATKKTVLVANVLKLSRLSLFEKRKACYRQNLTKFEQRLFFNN